MSATKELGMKFEKPGPKVTMPYHLQCNCCQEGEEWHIFRQHCKHSRYRNHLNDIKKSVLVLVCSRSNYSSSGVSEDNAAHTEVPILCWNVIATATERSFHTSFSSLSIRCTDRCILQALTGQHPRLT